MKARIVPVINWLGVRYIAQVKHGFFSRWKDDGVVQFGYGGSFLEVEYFISAHHAIKWLNNKYGSNLNIVEYRP